MRPSSIVVIVLVAFLIFVALSYLDLWPASLHSSRSQDAYTTHTVEWPLAGNASSKLHRHSIMLLDPKLRQRIADYSSMESMAAKYESALKDLVSFLNHMPSTNMIAPSVHVDLLSLDSSVALWSEAADMQLKQWETFRRILDRAIILYKDSLFPQRNTSVMYYILLNAALGYHQSSPNLTYRESALYNALHAFHTASANETHSSSPLALSILQSLYGGRRLDCFDRTRAFQEHLQVLLDMSEHWVDIFQKSILKLKFQSKAVHARLDTMLAETTRSSPLQQLSNSTRPFEPALKNASINLVGSFLEKVSEAADSAENMLKDSEKVLEDQVNKGATLETVVRLDDDKREAAAPATEADPRSPSMPVSANPDNDDFLAEHPGDKSSRSLLHPVSLHAASDELAFTLADFENNQYVLSRPKDPTTNYEDPKLIHDIVILLVVSFLLAWLFESIGLPSFFGYVLAGIVLGPMGFQTLRNYVQIGSLSQFGVYFLIFTLGLEFSPEVIERAWRVSFVGTLLFTLALVTGLVTVAYLWLSAGVGEAVVFSLCLSLSSTAVTLKMLASSDHRSDGSLDSGPAHDLQSTLFGASMMGISVAQDVVLCLLLALLPLFKGAPEAGPVDAHRLLTVVGTLMLKLFIALTLAFYACRLIARRSSLSYAQLGRSLLRAYPSELYSLGLVVCCLCSGKVCDYFGLSMEFGCFLAGLMIGSTGTHTKGEFVEKATHRLLPISDFFTIFFFNAIGLHVNPNFLIGEAAGLLLISFGVIVCKTLLLAFILIGFARMDWASAFMTGLGMSHITEFSFVIAGRSKRAGIFSREAYYIMVGVTSCCLIMTPILWQLALLVSKRLALNISSPRVYSSGASGTKSSTLVLGHDSPSHSPALHRTLSDASPSISVVIDGRSAAA